MVACCAPRDGRCCDDHTTGTREGNITVMTDGTDRAVEKPAGPRDDDQAARKARADRMTQIMWAYICGAIAVLSFMVGFGSTFIPLGFGILGGVLDWQLLQKGERRHSVIAGAMALGGILIWLTVNAGWIRADLGL